LEGIQAAEGRRVRVQRQGQRFREEARGSRTTPLAGSADPRQVRAARSESTSRVESVEKKEKKEKSLEPPPGPRIASKPSGGGHSRSASSSVSKEKDSAPPPSRHKERSSSVDKKHRSSMEVKEVKIT
jgi:hypothetical protein